MDGACTDERSFQVVFRGEVASGEDPAQVKRRFAELYRCEAETAEALFTGKPVVLHRGLSRARADGIRSTLAAAGFEVRVFEEPRVGPPPAAARARVPPLLGTLAICAAFLVATAGLIATWRWAVGSDDPPPAAAAVDQATSSPPLPTATTSPRSLRAVHIDPAKLQQLSQPAQPLARWVGRDSSADRLVAAEVERTGGALVAEAMSRAREACTWGTVTACTPRGHTIGSRTETEIVFYVVFNCEGVGTGNGRTLRGQVYLPRNLVRSGDSWVPGTSWQGTPPVVQHGEWLFAD